jgi:aryl-alcohol dehydrogenase-like predicted oxidoreductase
MKAYKGERIMTTAMKRTLGRGGLEVSALGLGCWAIGGEWNFNGKPAGWGKVDDNESIRAIQRALDLGITFFDTADAYGCGHSERVLGQAVAGRRDQVVIATKFGLLFNEETREGAGNNASPSYIKSAVEASLRRLRTDYIDLYQLHPAVNEEQCNAVVVTLEELVKEGKIRFYGTAAEQPETVRIFARGEHCVSVQLQLNIFGGNEEVLALCEEHNLASICRSPLAMGLLTGKYRTPEEVGAGDVRRHTPWWDYFKEGTMEEWLKKVESVRAVLTEDGRTLAQGALGWILAQSSKTIPIPGFRSVAQVEENVGALQYGPLSAQQVEEIRQLLG